MPRIKTNSYATKAVAMSETISDELMALEGAITAAKKARDNDLQERKRLERLRDSVPFARSTRGFSLFADLRNGPK
jgi:hypothetical protein